MVSGFRPTRRAASGTVSTVVEYYNISLEKCAVAASAFLRSANPQLDDQAPLVVLADGDPAEAGPRVVAAARALLEG